jgi:hypothetical protein
MVRSIQERIEMWIFRLMNKRRLFTHAQIEPVISANRKTLSEVKQWIRDDVYENSLFQYGLPRRVRHLIDKEIGNDVCYTDVILHQSQFLKQEINYLEVGVSVGKNFFQVANFLEGATLTGIDIEEINPTLESFFNRGARVEWSSKHGSIKTTKSSITEYAYPIKRNHVKYLCGDIWDENSWKRFSGQQFNLIFSDALHDPAALLFEFEMIKKYKLLNEKEFVMIWDDLGGQMTTSFMRIWADLSRQRNLDNTNKAITLCRGWLGINEHKHTIGIIASFSLDS